MFPDTTDVRLYDGEVSVNQAGQYSVTLLIVGDQLIEDTQEVILLFSSDNDNDRIMAGLGEPTNALVVTLFDNDGEILKDSSVFLLFNYYMCRNIIVGYLMGLVLSTLVYNATLYASTCTFKDRAFLC